VEQRSGPEPSTASERHGRREVSRMIPSKTVNLMTPWGRKPLRRTDQRSVPASGGRRSDPAATSGAMNVPQSPRRWHARCRRVTDLTDETAGCAVWSVHAAVVTGSSGRSVAQYHRGRWGPLPRASACAVPLPQAPSMTCRVHQGGSGHGARRPDNAAAPPALMMAGARGTANRAARLGLPLKRS
jgi:hypothetical protein